MKTIRWKETDQITCVATEQRSGKFELRRYYGPRNEPFGSTYTYTRAELTRQHERLAHERAKESRRDRNAEIVAAALERVEDAKRQAALSDAIDDVAAMLAGAIELNLQPLAPGLIPVVLAEKVVLALRRITNETLPKIEFVETDEPEIDTSKTVEIPPGELPIVTESQLVVGAEMNEVPF
jgi:hypothetical protein